MKYSKILTFCVCGFLSLSACGREQVSLSDPPLDSDGKSRYLFVAVPGPAFVGELYAVKAGSDSWGRDLVLLDNIYPGDRRFFNLADGSGNCRFDIRTVQFDADGRRPMENFDVDLCEMNRKGQFLIAD